MTRRSYLRESAALTAVMVALAVGTASATPAGSPGMGYDIPLSELNKVRKEAPPKKVKSESKKKKPAEAKTPEAATTEQKAPPEAAAPVSPPASPPAAAASAAPPGVAAAPEVQVTAIPVETVSAPQPLTSPKKVQEPPQTAAVSARIYHSPFSYVVAGKRTVLQAVVSSDVDIKTVSCLVELPGGKGAAAVAMEKIGGTQFSYTATLPALAAEAPSLRYVIAVVDSSGRETRSPEFSTPVTTSPVLPGWQLDNAAEPPRAEPQQGRNPEKTGTAAGVTR